ncbi:hypothetical protein QFC24_002390 [Naganishia onofrii]|uniref:Uncharacterized protein n=1 Tax=Naganishia onofrii TaxID=1851511 RepID=A0ACC2XS83_9TREE|nr:hypothetical protein QFC24_002390 [Naganishia onofrii]
MSKVLLYVYDLSGGLARQLSLPLTGKFIEGIWHTSVVVYGREIYYGQGILESLPGKTHHGQPVRQIDCGVTEIPEDMFNEYLDDLRSSYTASKYHLLDFNCNSFTADVVGFLTGNEIPEWITNLPSEFLSTPFGQSLRPQIDQMFGRGAANLPSAAAPVSPGAARQGINPQAAAAIQNAMMGSGNRQGMSPMANSLLASVAAQASSFTPSNNNGTATPPQQSITSSTTSPLTFSTNLASFTSTLHSHTATFALFTSRSDIVTRQVQQVFEGIAQDEKKRRQGGSGAAAGGDVAFVEVDVDMPSGKEVASTYGVLDTPGYAFFKGDQKIQQLGRTPSAELRQLIATQIQASISQ